VHWRHTDCGVVACLPTIPLPQVLNQNPDNFHNDNESLAFCPGVIVPGIGYSEDKLLQTRIFSYADTQRYRLGANYLQLPINAPKCPFHNNHHDGQGNMCVRDEEVNYFPSRNCPAAHAQPHPMSQKQMHGKREKMMIGKENNFAQVCLC
jgi:catalase